MFKEIASTHESFWICFRNMQWDQQFILLSYPFFLVLPSSSFPFLPSLMLISQLFTASSVNFYSIFTHLHLHEQLMLQHSTPSALEYSPVGRLILYVIRSFLINYLIVKFNYEFNIREIFIINLLIILILKISVQYQVLIFMK